MSLRGPFRKIGKLCRLVIVSDYRRALYFGVGAGIEHANLLRSLRPALVVDVGANVGQFSLATRHECPDARIIAFEPLAKAAAVFRKVFADDTNVTLHQVAIGPTPIAADMRVSAKMDSSSLLPISDRQMKYFPGTDEIGTERVTVRPLTDFLDDADLKVPALLKIDVQGSEREVLQSAAALLRRFQWIYVEASLVEFYVGQALADEIVRSLHEHGFILQCLYNPSNTRNGEVMQADFLFKNSSALDMC